MLKLGLIVISVLFCSQVLASKLEIDLLGKLEMIEEHQPDIKKRLAAKYQIIHLLSKCEFDEQCELNMKSELEALYQQDKNIMYKAFLKHLEWQKSNLEYNLKNCQSEEKKAVRKIFAQCYQQWIEEEVKHPKVNRQEFDKNEENRYRCIKANAQELANKGNIFAQAEMVNLAERLGEASQMTQWTAKIESLKGTSKFEHYLRCSELP